MAWGQQGNIRGPQGNPGQTGPAGPPSTGVLAVVEMTGTQGVGADQNAPIVWDTTVLTRGIGWTRSGSRLYVPGPGVILAIASAGWLNLNIGNTRGVDVRLNGTDVYGGNITGNGNAGSSGNGYLTLNGSAVIPVTSSNDYLEACAWQTSGGTQTVTGAQHRTRLSLIYLSVG